MLYAKYKAVAAVLTCCLGLGIGAYQFAPQPAAAQAPAKSTAAAPDVEPIDPNLVFDPQVQKDLRLSKNQVRQLTEARDKVLEKVADRTARVGEIEKRMKELQAEMDRLARERDGAQGAIEKAQTEQVRAAIPNVLSRDAVRELRQMTLQRMPLNEALLDPKVRARLGLNDEQVKKIQDLAEKSSTSSGRYTTVALKQSRFVTLVDGDGSGNFLLDSASIPRGELLKILTPAQRSALERMAGITFEKEK